MQQKQATRYPAVSSFMLIESFDLWDDDDNASEMTHYRRVASLLDVVFKKTGIRLHDGETGSKSTKLERETNKAIFHTKDTSPTYPRKIDLLLKCNDAKTDIEMSSNEWKRASVSKNVQLMQQCKNLRINTVILKNLKKLGVNKTLSMDWTGNSGYIYQLEWCPDQEVYLASNCIIVQLPSSPLLLFDLKPTLESFFGLKLSLLQDAKIIKASLQVQKQKKNMQGVADSCSLSIRTPASTSLLNFLSSLLRIS
ncbi:uncharacterized protein EV154DRAFT_69116 [Mucor mucedo]|uniref:uncharacterized protein n=1 Tax=Mucor mucedo TaxID=29922 RepID=UPI0022209D5F|nr:uncharacterized protein EV154DRAFT_69116 [Mucor mucedo]KAI7894668.1 hypothetical protein EV154DRAFT_69116 [Mucor mucedo]